MTTLRTLALRLVVLLAAVLGLVTVTAAPSSAYTYRNSGYPGSVTAPRIVGQTIDFDDARITFPARTAYKSTRYGAYAQKVCVTYNLVYAGLSGSTTWYPYGSYTTCSALNGSSATVGGAYWDVYTYFIYSGNVVVNWYLANGTWIGRTVEDYNQVGDYSCTCTVASTTSLGAYMLF